jgi:hypothetical protein
MNIEPDEFCRTVQECTKKSNFATTAKQRPPEAPVNRERVQIMLEAVAAATEDEEPGKRAQALRDTFEKLENGGEQLPARLVRDDDEERPVDNPVRRRRLKSGDQGASHPPGTA